MARFAKELTEAEEERLWTRKLQGKDVRYYYFNPTTKVFTFANRAMAFGRSRVVNPTAIQPTPEQLAAWGAELEDEQENTGQGSKPAEQSKVSRAMALMSPSRSGAPSSRSGSSSSSGDSVCRTALP